MPQFTKEVLDQMGDVGKQQFGSPHRMLVETFEDLGRTNPELVELTKAWALAEGENAFKAVVDIASTNKEMELAARASSTETFGGAFLLGCGFQYAYRSVMLHQDFKVLASEEEAIQVLRSFKGKNIGSQIWQWSLAEVPLALLLMKQFRHPIYMYRFWHAVSAMVGVWCMGGLLDQLQVPMASA